MSWAEHFSWAVAWATNNDWTALLLEHHSNKINHLLIGTDFNRTSPDFIYFGVPKASINFENYWECVVHPIMTSNWWQNHRPASLVDGQIWDGRAAMLDVLFYQPNS